MHKHSRFIIGILSFFYTVFPSENASNFQGANHKEELTKVWITKLITGAAAQIGKTIRYDSSYQKISYPNGDFSIEYGVCTDVIIRAFRAMGIDLQKLIHEDMEKNWDEYPKLWRMKKTDRNIDHRRVPNIATFFQRLGMQVKDANFFPGDIIVWDLGGGILHIGILAEDKVDEDYLVIHNISSGVKKENILNEFKIVAKYRLNNEIFKKLKIIITKLN